MSTDVKRYIEKALERGGSKDTIKATLIQAGWAATVTDKLLAQYAMVDGVGLAVPAPRMQSHQIARDLFFYLLALITLSLSALGVGGLLFYFIDYLWPNAMDPYPRQIEHISWAIAQVMIAFPIYSMLSAWIRRDIQTSPEKRESLIRKLMIYLILVLSSITALCDLTMVLTRFLEGEITFRFLAQALVVLGIALMILVYYLYEVRQDDRLVLEGRGQ